MKFYQLKLIGKMTFFQNQDYLIRREILRARCHLKKNIY